MPKNLPEGLRPTEEDIPKLSEWLLQYYGSTVFNTCEHQPLPMMKGPDPQTLHWHWSKTSSNIQASHCPSTLAGKSKSRPRTRLPIGGAGESQPQHTCYLVLQNGGNSKSWWFSTAYGWPTTTKPQRSTSDPPHAVTIPPRGASATKNMDTVHNLLQFHQLLYHTAYVNGIVYS